MRERRGNFENIRVRLICGNPLGIPQNFENIRDTRKRTSGNGFENICDTPKRTSVYALPYRSRRTGIQVNLQE
jgi:hypothetical protein